MTLPDPLPPEPALPDPTLVAGLILAGGLATRLGGADKALVTLDGQSLLARSIARARPQVGRLLLSANGDARRFECFSLPVLADPLGDHWGPLVGILAGLEHLARDWPDILWLASFATDCPFLPLDLVARLASAIERDSADLAMARSAGRLQPVFALWPVRLAVPLRQALQQGLRKVDQFARSYKLALVDWPEEAFFNINTPDDLAQAMRKL